MAGIVKDHLAGLLDNLEILPALDQRQARLGEVDVFQAQGVPDESYSRAVLASRTGPDSGLEELTVILDHDGHTAAGR